MGNKKIFKTEKLEVIDMVSYNAFSLNDFILKLEAFKKKYEEKKYSNLKIEFENTHGYYDSIDSELVLYGTREETDAEFNTRLKQSESAKLAAKKRKAAAEKAEYTRYIKLKEKYENKKV